MPTSVRLDPETELLLRRLAQRSGRSKSDVIREALNRLAEESTGGVAEGDLYASVADLMGCIRGGTRPPARQHKRTYRESLEKKHRK